MKTLSVQDLSFVFGLSFLATGVGMFSLPASLIAVGSVLLFVSILGAVRGK